MNKERVKALLYMLSKSQGFYGRLLEWLDGLEEEYENKWYAQFKDCKDEVGVILMIEG